MNGPLEEQMGGVLVCDKVCLNVVSTSTHQSYEVSASPGAETPGEGISDN